jgi:hypothetical protein
MTAHCIYSISQLWGIFEMVFDATKNTNSSIHLICNLKKIKTLIHDCIALRIVNFVLTVLLKLGYELMTQTMRKWT